MKPAALVAAGLLAVAVAIAYHAGSARYSMAMVGPDGAVGVAVLDRRTGKLCTVHDLAYMEGEYQGRFLPLCSSRSRSE